MNRPPRHIGPYELLQTLGQGGMGTVYLAQHRALDRRVALKTLRTSSPGHLRALRRELRALRALEHPHVVRVVDSGLDGDTPWFAMTLLCGRPLSAHLAPRHVLKPSGQAWTHHLALSETLLTQEITQGASAPDPSLAATLDSAQGLALDLGPAPDAPPTAAPAPSAAQELNAALAQRLRWLAQVAQALGYIHGEGMVHLDVKPDNILITEEGRAVLLDFGLAQRFAHRVTAEQLESSGVFAGTTRYISPERARSRVLDARADLYAMGCILYEAVTGRPPFTDTQTVALLRKHITAPPTPPSALGVALPALLEELILGLLAKSPHARPSHAGVIVETLAGLGVDVSSPTPLPTPRAHLLRTGLLGRDALIHQLDRHSDRVARGEGVTVALCGESGVGKSKLAEDLIRRARQEGARVVICHSRAPMEHQRPAPLHTLAALWRAAREAEGEPPVRDALAAASPLLPYDPTLGAWAEATEAPQSAEQAKAALAEATSRIIAALTEAAPLLLVIDDLQWADPLTLGVLERTVLREPPPRCLTLGLCQLRGASGEVARLIERPPVTTLRVERLGEGVIADIIRQMMGAREGLPPDLLEGLVGAAGGNPLFAIENLRLAVERGLLRRGDDGRWVAAVRPGEALPTPRTVREIIDARLEALPRDAALLASAAALIGRELDATLLERVSTLSDAHHDAALATLLQRAVLEADGDALRFPHAHLREAALARLPEATRRALHGRAAEALRERRERGEPIEVSALARHQEAAGDHAAAIDAYIEAANADADRFALANAEASFQRARALTSSDDPRAITARWRLARRVLLRQGRLEEAIPVLKEAIQIASEQGERSEQWSALMTLAQARVMSGRLADASAALTDASALIADLGDPYRHGCTLVTAGIVAFSRGHHDEALALWTRALALAVEADHAPLQSTTRINIANAHTLAGRSLTAMALYEEALAHYQSSGDKEGEGSALNNILVLLGDTSAPAEQIAEVARRSFAIWDELGDGYYLGFLHQTWGASLRSIGRLDDAEPILQRALAYRLELGHAIDAIITRAELASLALDQRDLDRATALWRDALAQADTAEETPNELLFLSARLHRLHGRLPEALQALDAVAGRVTALAVKDQLSLLSERAHLARATGDDPTPLIHEARALFATTELGQEALYGRMIAALEEDR